MFTDSISEYERVGNQIRELFASSIELKEEQIQLCAVVCGIMHGENLKDSDTLLSYADYLISLAPESTDTFFTQSDDSIMENFRYRKEIERYLRIAIEGDLFEIYFQPVYSQKQGKYVSLEALSRLNHPEFGSVPPDIFITIAEKTGQIAQIGLLQLRKICTFFKEHQQLLLMYEHVNVNLSPAELLRNGHSRQIIEIIQESGLPFDFFQFEITETVATEYSARLYQMTREVEACGIHFSLDDFGSGYANFNTVMKLPFSCIKLDRSLLIDILENQKTELFYRNIVLSLNGMGYEVIAEGVEKKEEVDLLRSFGVDLIQGFYYSGPVPAEELLKPLGTEFFGSEQNDKK